jgi:hypothetical protein
VFVSSHRLLHRLPENLEYNLIKRLIKENTTARSARAISIPGQGNEVEHAFENKVLKALVDNHNRIGLFVKSKCGEIDSRLSTFVASSLVQEKRIE